MSVGTTHRSIKGLGGPSFPNGNQMDLSAYISNQLKEANRLDHTASYSAAYPVDSADEIYPGDIRAHDRVNNHRHADELQLGADNTLKKAKDLSAMLSEHTDGHTHDRAHDSTRDHEHKSECLTDSADVNPTLRPGLSNEQKAKLAKTKTYFEYFAELMGVRLFKKYSPASGSVWNNHHIKSTSRYDLTETISNAWDYTRSHVQNIIVYYLLMAVFAIFFPDAYNPTYLFRGWLIFTIYEFYLLMVHHYNRTLAGRVLEVLTDEDDEPMCRFARHDQRPHTKKTEEDPLAMTPFVVEDVHTFGHIFPSSFDVGTEMAITKQPIYALMYRENRYPVANFINKDEAIAFGKELHTRYQPQEMLDWFMKPSVRHALNEMRNRTIPDTSADK
jgi:hypothetical protein